MAETSTTEKVYCIPDSNSSLNPMLSALLTNQNNGMNNPMAMMAMANGGMNNWNNNPWSYIMMMWLMRMWGNNGWDNNGVTAGENANSRAIATLQDTVNQNHLNSTVLDALSNNQAAIRELAQTFNTDLNTIQQACCGINSSIQQVGGNLGLGIESVKNAIAQGDNGVIRQMCDCCCSTKTLIADGFNQTQRTILEGNNATQREILNGSYQTQLGTERQTGIVTSQMAAQHAADQLQDAQNNAAVLSRIDQLANGVTQLGAQLGYQSEKNTASIIQNATANTQKTLDAICQQTTQQLRDELASAERQLQSQTIINQLRGSGCGCNA